MQHLGLGLGFVFTTVDESGSDTQDFDFDSSYDFAVRVGGGVNAFVTETISLQGTVAYSIGTGDIDDFETVNIIAGVQYHFF